MALDYPTAAQKKALLSVPAAKPAKPSSLTPAEIQMMAGDRHPVRAGKPSRSVLRTAKAKLSEVVAANGVEIANIDARRAVLTQQNSELSGLIKDLARALE